MIESDPDRLRRRAEVYDRLRREISDERALQVLQEMADEYRAQAEKLLGQTAIAADPPSSSLDVKLCLALSRSPHGMD